MARPIIGHIKMKNIRSVLSLYFIAGTQDCRHLAGDPATNLLSVLQQALQAGVTCFQFRDKGEGSLQAHPAHQQAIAIQCRDLCRRYQVPFIVNDDVELALAVEADGIHVGQSDTDIQSILARTAKKLILGLSINTQEQALADAERMEIDYFGIGPIFPTQSKQDHKPAVGLEFISRLRRLGVNKPCVAIGGINATTAKQLRHLGADGVAVISAITQADDIAQAVRQLKEA